MTQPTKPTQPEPDEHGPETARALLYRHGLPEDVIDGALALHAHQLAQEIRAETRRAKADGVLEPELFRPCRDAANQIDPLRDEFDVDPDEAAVRPPVTQPDGRRDRYAAAIRENAGWVLDDGQHMVDAVMAVADAEQAELRARVLDYENRITWHTACASCARVLDSSIRDTEEADTRRVALSGALGLGSGASWEAVLERVAELAEVCAAVPPLPASRPAPSAVLRSFVLWLDASDGSVPSHDGVVWPDGAVTLHHRHFGLTTTHPDVETAVRLAHGGQGRVVWPEPPTPASRPAPTPALAALREQMLDALDFSYCASLNDHDTPEALLAAYDAAFEADLHGKGGPKVDSKTAASRPALREEIAAALAREGGHDWGPGKSSLPSGVIERYHRLADALLAGHDNPAAECPECGSTGACNGGPCPLHPVAPSGSPAAEADRLRKEHETWRKLGRRNLRAAHEENARLRAELRRTADHPAVAPSGSPAAIRAAVLREAGDTLEKAADEHEDYYVPQGLYEAAIRLRRMADEAQPAAPETPAEENGDPASCPGYETSPNPCRCPCDGCGHHCSAHNPDGQAQPASLEIGAADFKAAAPTLNSENTSPLVQVGWWCWRGTNGHLATTPCRSDNVPLHAPAEWADDMRAAIAHLEDEEQPAELTEPDNPTAWALAQHIGDHPISTVQAAFRYLGMALTLKVQDEPDAAPVHVGGRANAETCPACRERSNPPYPFLCPAEPGTPALGAAEIETRPDLNVTPLAGDALDADTVVEPPDTCRTEERGDGGRGETQEDGRG
ncbi:hypothetical protein ACIQPQ_31480 [Streptomyces sp. NPDC091281]|uniref:hypothetical protein n=1 Tax=Streptomyces sp. NPDC091281 TaxID=3365985 RepID=UPI00381DB80F